MSETTIVFEAVVGPKIANTDAGGSIRDRAITVALRLDGLEFGL